MIAPDYAPPALAKDPPIAEWIEQFHRDGYLVLHDLLPADMMADMRADLDRGLEREPQDPNGVIELRHRMFEISPANLRLFSWEPVVTFAEQLIVSATHVIRNNSFRVRPGGGIATWHQDDSPHYIVTEGEPPTNVRLPFCCSRQTTTSPTSRRRSTARRRSFPAPICSVSPVLRRWRARSTRAGSSPAADARAQW